MQYQSDNDLLLQLKADDHSAFDMLFDRYWERLYRAAIARVDDDHVAQDVVQELFIKLWERRRTINIRSSVENYLLSAVRFGAKLKTQVNYLSADAYKLTQNKLLFPIPQYEFELNPSGMIQDPQ